MAYEKLKNLAESYPTQRRDALSQMATKYRRRHEREVLELAAIASDVSIDDVANLGLESDLNPRFKEAFQSQYPNVSLDSLEGATEERLLGFTNGVKGKYFEVLVRDKLNAGERVGNIQLEPGQTARLASSPTQPGWDLRIEDSNGEVVQDLQLKATESMYYVKEALEKHPDIKVVVPSELDAEAALRDDVIATGLSNEDLGDETRTKLGELGELSEGNLKDLADNSAEFGFDSLPLVSAAVIAATEGGMVMLGRSTMKEAIQRGKGRLLRTGVYSTVGTVLMATPVGPIAVPTTMALRIAEGRIRNVSAAGEYMEEKSQELHKELERPTTAS